MTERSAKGARFLAQYAKPGGIRAVHASSVARGPQAGRPNQCQHRTSEDARHGAWTIRRETVTFAGGAGKLLQQAYWILTVSSLTTFFTPFIL
jgi:hypothetical protein